MPGSSAGRWCWVRRACSAGPCRFRPSLGPCSGHQPVSWSLRKSRVVHEAPAAGLEKEEDDSSDNDDDDDDEVPGDDDDEEDAEAADFADVDSATAADAEETAAGDKHAAKAAAADAVIAAKLGEVVEKSGTILSKKVTAKWTVVAPHSAAVESTSSSKMLPIRRLIQ